MTAYSPTNWINDNPPPMSAANLDHMTDELELQASNFNVPHSLPDWTDGAVPAITDAAPWNEIERVLQLVTDAAGLASYTKTIWAEDWTPARNAANLNKIEQQLVRVRNAIDGISAGYDFRAIYVQDIHFSTCYPTAFRTMNLSAMECAIFSGTSNVLTRMNQLSAPDEGWVLLGHYNESVTGGAFTLSDSQVQTIVTGIASHPRNSHRYSICDEPDNVGLYTTAQQELCRTTVRNRMNLIKTYDPDAIVNVVDFRQWNLDPVMTGRPGGMWGAPNPCVDEIWLDGYPTPNAVADPTRISDQAGWCDAAGMPYVIIASYHDYPAGGHSPDYPTQAQFTEAMRQIKATNAVGVGIYIWDDSDSGTQLRNRPADQTHVGNEMAAVTP